jgi:hypothetical protein
MNPYLVLSHHGSRVLLCAKKQNLISKLKAINGRTYSFHAIEDYGYMCISCLLYLCYN